MEDKVTIKFFQYKFSNEGLRYGIYDLSDYKSVLYRLQD